AGVRSWIRGRLPQRRRQRHWMEEPCAYRTISRTAIARMAAMPPITSAAKRPATTSSCRSEGSRIDMPGSPPARSHPIWRQESQRPRASFEARVPRDQRHPVDELGSIDQAGRAVLVDDVGAELPGRAGDLLVAAQLRVVAVDVPLVLPPPGELARL